MIPNIPLQKRRLHFFASTTSKFVAIIKCYPFLKRCHLYADTALFHPRFLSTLFVHSSLYQYRLVVFEDNLRLK